MTHIRKSGAVITTISCPCGWTAKGIRERLNINKKLHSKNCEIFASLEKTHITIPYNMPTNSEIKSNAGMINVSSRIGSTKN